jgi:hypothetical protein
MEEAKGNINHPHTHRNSALRGAILRAGTCISISQKLTSHEKSYRERENTASLAAAL